MFPRTFTTFTTSPLTTMTDSEQPTQQGTSVVPAAAAPPPSLVGPMNIADLMARVWTSLDLSNEANRETLVLAMQSDDAIRLSDIIKGDNKLIEVEHVVIHRVPFVDENGEEIEADRVVLIHPSGEMYHAVSTGIVRSLQALSIAYGMPPWNPPITVRVQQGETRKGKRFFQMLPARQAQNNGSEVKPPRKR